MSERIVQQPVATGVQAKFSDLPTADTERSTFDMSHPWKGTCDTNVIVPCLLQEILPGDTFKINTTAFIRLATPLKPIMDSLTTDLHYFFVPNRLVWDNWQAFMGERKNPDDDPTELSIPQINLNLDIGQIGNLTDYFGLPLVDRANSFVKVNTLPYRAYELIYNEWYRNENLQPQTTIPLDDGPDDPILFGLGYVKYRAKRADYFTKALPWPQKGDPVFLPLGEFAYVKGIGKQDQNYGFPNQNIRESDGTITEYANSSEVGGDNSQVFLQENPNNPGYPGVYADLTAATAATINDIRTAFQIQRLLERDARGGTRYIEILLSHFNVQSPDFRLQRPEYLGGGSARINISPVASTVATTEAPQGNLSAVGTGLVKGSMTHSFTEHGFLMCLMSSRADLTYQNGMDRIWSRTTRYDYYWPALSHLGEQAILNKELYWDPADVGNGDEINNGIWGYQERYAEYRYQPGRITGEFRSVSDASLDVWHLAQDFDSLPLLNNVFILEDPPIDRVVAVPSEPDLIVDMWHNMQATRAMPVYAVPGLVDHF